MDDYRGEERRKFKRFDFEKAVHCREIISSGDKKSFSSVVKGAVKNLSASGILFALDSIDIPNVSNLLLLELEYHTASICRELERRSLIARNRFLGKVVRVVDNLDGTSDVGVALVPKNDDLLSEIKIIVEEEVLP
jgi:hypothetical protein